MRYLQFRTFPNLCNLARPPDPSPDSKGLPNCRCDIITLIAWRPPSIASLTLYVPLLFYLHALYTRTRILPASFYDE